MRHLVLGVRILEGFMKTKVSSTGVLVPHFQQEEQVRAPSSKLVSYHYWPMVLMLAMTNLVLAKRMATVSF